MTTAMRKWDDVRLVSVWAATSMISAARKFAVSKFAIGPQLRYDGEFALIDGDWYRIVPSLLQGHWKVYLSSRSVEVQS